MITDVLQMLCLQSSYLLRDASRFTPPPRTPHHLNPSPPPSHPRRQNRYGLHSRGNIAALGVIMSHFVSGRGESCWKSAVTVWDCPGGFCVTIKSLSCLDASAQLAPPHKPQVEKFNRKRAGSYSRREDAAASRNQTTINLLSRIMQSGEGGGEVGLFRLL